MPHEPTPSLPFGQTAVRYKDVPGFPGYRVGDDGSAWSCRKHPRNRKGRWIQMTPHFDKGYPLIYVYRDGRRYSRKIHTLVLNTFVGPCPIGMQCRHLNGQPADSRLTNLRWGTPKENMADAVSHGTLIGRRGRLNPWAKLTDIEILKIKHLWMTKGFTTRRIAGMFGVSRTTILEILQGRSWIHVENPPGFVAPKQRKLTEEDRREILRLITKKYTHKEIAEQFQIDPSTVSRIIHPRERRSKVVVP